MDPLELRRRVHRLPSHDREQHLHVCQLSRRSLEDVPVEHDEVGQLAHLNRANFVLSMQLGLLAGLGYNGRGVAMATVMGRILANWARGAPAADLDFPVTLLAPIPLHRFNQIGARLAIQGLRALDGLARVRDRFLAVGSAP
jgi:glycine/D-amino acid oxidase-like deaminating enzyme